MSLFDGQFGFTCPIFNSITKLATCLKLRELVYRGQRPDVRKGCQACMSAGKCPADKIIQRRNFQKGYYATEYEADTANGKLGFHVLDRIRNTLVLPKTLDEYRVSEVERDLIAGATARIDAQIASAPKTEAQQKQLVASRKRTDSASAPTDPVGTPRDGKRRKADINSAAQTGDLSAAISKGE
jgi:hypothetical protein